MKTFLLILIAPLTLQQGCVIDPFTSSVPLEQPLVFWNHTNELVYPPLKNDVTDQSVTLNPGDSIMIVCVRGLLTSNIEIYANNAEAICGSDSQLMFRDEVLDYKTVNCEHPFRLGTLDRPGIACGGSGEIINIVLEVNLALFETIPVAQICFDSKARNVLYVQHNITKFIGFKHSFIEAGLNEDDGLYNLDVPLRDLYSVNKQRETINSLLGLPDDSELFIKDHSFALEGNLFTETEAFVYEIPQLANLRFINSAPVWRFISEKNWNKLVVDVIKYVAERKVDYEVYGGTYGVTTLPDLSGEDKELYLYVDDEGEKFLPVPAIIWKVVYEREAKSAIAFVIVNNVYQVRPEDIICNDISSALPWLTWRKNNVTEGFSYACTFDEFKATVTHMPELDVV